MLKIENRKIDKKYIYAFDIFLGILSLVLFFSRSDSFIVVITAAFMVSTYLFFPIVGPCNLLFSDIKSYKWFMKESLCFAGISILIVLFAAAGDKLTGFDGKFDTSQTMTFLIFAAIRGFVIVMSMIASVFIVFFKKRKESKL